MVRLPGRGLQVTMCEYGGSDFLTCEMVFLPPHLSTQITQPTFAHCTIWPQPIRYQPFKIFRKLQPTRHRARRVHRRRDSIIPRS